MKRWALRIFVLLLLGAIVNVAVAWACTVVAQEESGIVRKPDRGERVSVNRFLPAPYFVHGLPGDGTMVAFGYREITTLAYAYAAKGDPPRSPPKYLAVSNIEAGWPIRSLRRTAFGPRSDDAVSATLSNAMWQFPSVHSRAENRSFLPSNPIWPGFAINTVFYAVGLWLLFAAPFALRRRRRIKRGLCPKCAYPVGTSTVCTECGHPIKTA